MLQTFLGESAGFFEVVGLFLALTVVFVAALRVMQRVLKTGKASVADDDNPAHRLYAVGQIFGALVIAAAATHQSAVGEDFLRDAMWAGAFGAAGFALYVIGGQLGVRLLLGRKLAAEIDEGNVAAALAAGAHHIAIAFIAAESASGVDLDALMRSSGFFVIGIIAHQLVVSLFRAFTTYDDAEQIAGENLAAALRYAGATLGTAIIVARALDGDATDPGDATLGFLGVASIALLLIPVRQLVAGGLLLGKMPKLRGGPLDEAVTLKHDNTLAALDAAVAVAAALAFVRLLG